MIVYRDEYRKVLNLQPALIKHESMAAGFSRTINCCFEQGYEYRYGCCKVLLSVVHTRQN